MKLWYGLELHEYETIESEDKYYCLELSQKNNIIGTYNLPVYEESEPSDYDVLEQKLDKINEIVSFLKLADKDNKFKQYTDKIIEVINELN